MSVQEMVNIFGEPVTPLKLLSLSLWERIYSSYERSGSKTVFLTFGRGKNFPLGVIVYGLNEESGTERFLFIRQGVSGLISGRHQVMIEKTSDFLDRPFVKGYLVDLRAKKTFFEFNPWEVIDDEQASWLELGLTELETRLGDGFVIKQISLEEVEGLLAKQFI